MTRRNTAGVMRPQLPLQTFREKDVGPIAADFRQDAAHKAFRPSTASRASRTRRKPVLSKSRGAAFERGFSGHGWLTFRQALERGGHVRKGERDATVVRVGRFVPKEERRCVGETGEAARDVPFLKRFTRV